MTSTWSGLLLVSIALPWLMCLAAPHAELSGDPGFQEFASKHMLFVLWVRNALSELKGLVSEAFGYDYKEWLHLAAGLGIEQVDVSHCKQDPCDIERCFNQLQAGLQTYSTYLTYVYQILTTYNERILRIQHAISHLHYNIQQEMEQRGLTSVVYPQAEDVPTFVEVLRKPGSYLVLHKLQLFLETIFRSLRHCSTKRESMENSH